MFMEFTTDWEDPMDGKAHKKGEVAEFPKMRIGEILGAHVALNADGRVNMEKTMSSLGIVQAQINGMKRTREFFQKKIAAVDKRLEDLELRVKMMMDPVKDKMIRRSNTKEA